MKRIILTAIVLIMISVGNVYAQSNDEPTPAVMVAQSATNINTADVVTLDALPGIGPVLAKRIVDHRSENGSFTSVDQLTDVKGIGENSLAKIKPLINL